MRKGSTESISGITEYGKNRNISRDRIMYGNGDAAKEKK